VEPEPGSGSAVIFNLDELLPFKGLASTSRIEPPDSAGNEVFLRACRAVSSIQDIDDLERRLVSLISDCVPAERGVILLKGQVEGEFAAVTGWHKRSDSELSAGTATHLSAPLDAWSQPKNRKHAPKLSQI